MDSRSRREFLRASAAASALVALGARSSPAPRDPERFAWTRYSCTLCEARCGVHLGAVDGVVIAMRGDVEQHNAGFLCPCVTLPPHGGRERFGTVAGVLFLTAPGAAPRVATRLSGERALALTGGDGDARIAAVWETDGTALDAFAARLLRADAEILRIWPTFVGRDAEA
jgi:hypothetical protein